MLLRTEKKATGGVMAAPTPTRPWGSSSPEPRRSPDSARRAGRSAGEAEGPVDDRSSRNADGDVEYRGERFDCGMCARESCGVKKKVKHSSIGRCRLSNTSLELARLAQATQLELARLAQATQLEQTATKAAAAAAAASSSAAPAEVRLN